MTKTAASATVIRVAVVTCGCGLLPLEDAMHATSALAWQAAARHVALNPAKCHPSMNWDHVPALVAAGLPR